MLIEMIINYYINISSWRGNPIFPFPPPPLHPCMKPCITYYVMSFAQIFIHCTIEVNIVD